MVRGATREKTHFLVGEKDKNEPTFFKHYKREAQENWKRLLMGEVGRQEGQHSSIFSFCQKPSHSLEAQGESLSPGPPFA